MTDAAEKVDVTTDTTTDTTATDTTQQTDVVTQDKGDSKSATVLNMGDKTQADKTTAPVDWPEDWRTKLAGGDEKLLKQLDRFASPKALHESYRALQQKISSGELKASKLPDNATDEQKAEWRKENGIPEKPDQYLADLPNGLVIGEDDKELVSGFVEAMHAQNAPKGFVQAALAWHQELKEQVQEQQYTASTQAKQATEDALRTEYGQEYRANLNQVQALLNSAPEGVLDLMINARDESGVQVINNTNVVRWLVNIAKEMNPVATLVGAGNNPNAIEDELTTISKARRENPDAYWKDERMQARERELLAAQERTKQRQG